MRHEFDEARRADPDRLALAERAAAVDAQTAGTAVPSAVARWRLPGRRAGGPGRV